MRATRTVALLLQDARVGRPSRTLRGCAGWTIDRQSALRPTSSVRAPNTTTNPPPAKISGKSAGYLRLRHPIKVTRRSPIWLRTRKPNKRKRQRRRSSPAYPARRRHSSTGQPIYCSRFSYNSRLRWGVASRHSPYCGELSMRSPSLLLGQRIFDQVVEGSGPLFRCRMPEHC
jgi:hypothetical protein